MSKICIIGNGCAGKTTLGKKLSQDLSLPFFEMDEKLKFLKTTPFPTRQQIRHFSRELNKLLDKDKWVIEGWGYKETYEERFKKADIIIFLDVPFQVCLERCHKRLGSTNLEILKRGVTKLNIFDKHVRPLLLKLIQKYKNEPKKIILEIDQDFKYEDILRQINMNTVPINKKSEYQTII
ncbi:adenylate kinase DNA topology modulator [Priestia sp. JV24]|nr:MULTISPECIES: shikimate kinase [Priestia]MCU7713050.1 adenylate kinase DNA topology modulator [Priestia megaterium]MCW1049139.1 adenylate kinase DNA topology modulator [Priestia sp. JV24]